MAHENDEEGLIRRYLLGRLGEDELERLEERIMGDTEFFNRVLLAEDEIVEKYVEGELPESDRADFKASFESTPEGRLQVSLAEALRQRYKQVPAEHGEPSQKKESIISDPEAEVRSFAAGAGAGVPVEKEQPSAKPPRERSVSRQVWWSRPAVVPYFGLAAAAVIVIGLGIGTWRMFFYQSDLDKGLAALSQAYREHRPVEPRISGLEYAPTAVTRGGLQKVDTVSLHRAERILLDEASEHPNADSQHALGRLYLAEQKFDDALREFEEAVQTDPNNAQLHNDYGAALLEKGKADRSLDDSGKSLEEFARALEHFTKALELNGNLLEALFNRALCNQYLMLPRQAEADWRTYLERDGNSQWSDEARQHLKRLEEERSKTSQKKEDVLQSFISTYERGDHQTAWRISSQNREALSGRCVGEQLLNAYLDASLSDQRNNASKMLEALLRLGELERGRGGDSYTLGLAQFYRSLPRKQLETLSRAQKLVSEGKAYYAQGNPKRAIEEFTKAKQIFSEAGDRWEAILTDYWIAYSYAATADVQHSGAIYARLEGACKENNFKWLLMRTQVGWSVVQFVLNNYSKAIEHTHRGLELAEQLNDDNGSFNAWSYLIEYYRYIGNYSASLHCVQKSLPFINTASLGNLQRFNHYAIIASALNSAGFYPAAISYQEESVWLAKAIDNPATRCVAHVHLGLMYGRVGKSNQAIGNIQLAYEIAKSCSDEAVRTNQMAYAALQMGNLQRQAGDFSRAIESFDESIGLYERLDYPAFYYQAHKGKLLCYIAQQNDTMAREELQYTLGLAETYRSAILEGDNRNNFFDIEQGVYDLAIDFEYSRENDPRQAFEYSEASRARSLLDLLTTNTYVLTKGSTPDLVMRDNVRPLSLSAIEERLPDRVQILQYAVLPDKLLIWVVSRTSFSMIEKSIDQEYLSDEVLRYLRLISTPTDASAEELSRAAKELSDILIAPVELLLDRTKQLCIVPDKILSYLPFSALMSASSNRYLIEVFPMMYSPSSSVLVLCSEQAGRKLSSAGESLLSVGNPSFDRNAFPSLPDLPSAGTEAKGIAAYYGSSRSLVGNQATKKAVKLEIEKSNVIHFAMHALVDESSPMRSKLLLAKDQFGDASNDASQGAMESHEIYGLKLGRARLVVLSACQTGIERYYKGEGMISIARPFIVAGVPIVVASLWPVDSDATADLMINFHKHRKLDGVSTAEALRRAQLELLSRSGDRARHPYFWASFFPIGGYTSF